MNNCRRAINKYSQRAVIAAFNDPLARSGYGLNVFYENFFRALYPKRAGLKSI